MKELKKLIGAKTLSKKEQLNVKGGSMQSDPPCDCKTMRGTDCYEFCEEFKP